jgi:hypothetical protein
METTMLKPARVGFFFASLLAMTGTAEAKIQVIYPPQSYQAPFEFCPLMWPAYFSCGCYYGYHHGYYSYGHYPHHHHGYYPKVGSATGVHVIKAGRKIITALSQAE